MHNKTCKICDRLLELRENKNLQCFIDTSPKGMIAYSEDLSDGQLEVICGECVVAIVTSWIKVGIKEEDE